MPTSNKKWFKEAQVSGNRKGAIKHSFLIDKVIFKGKTDFQEVFIFENPLYGRIFCLDDIIEFSEKDEFIYHEMISHPALFSHPNPKNILIIGGGDGGALRQVLKHPIKRVDLVEIDKDIIKIAKRCLKFSCANSFSDKRVKVHNMPGQVFIKDYKDFYDIVIIDSTNPEPGNPAKALYSDVFYKNVFSSLTKNGIVITLGASFLDFENFIKKIFKRMKKVFPNAVVYKFCMPSYYCGEYGFIAGSKKLNLKKIDFKEIKTRFKKISKRHKFSYYSPKVHKASMVLPQNWKL